MWEEKKENKDANRTLADMVEVKFQMWIPPIEKLDASTSMFPKCEFLSLNTNMIERISNLNSLKFLKILSVGRNLIKSLAGVEVCADTLEEIWASYNQIEKPTVGTVKCKKLRALYLANNWVREMGEVSRLADLPKLEELVLVGCPVNERFVATSGEEDWMKEVAKRIKHLKKLDGQNLQHEEAEQEE